MENIKIIGTSHIAAQSHEDIKKAFLDFKPEIVAVELDKQRLAGLQGGETKLGWTALRTLGVRGYLFALFGRYVQQRMGRMVGMKPGAEMLYAVQLAHRNKLLAALIDKPIQKTIRRMMKKFTFREFLQIFGDLFSAINPFKKKERIRINLSGVPDEKLIEKLMKELKKKYPSIHQVLVDERNHYMAKQLVVISKRTNGKKILAVVGAGHRKEMLKLIKKYEKEIDVIT